MAIYYMDSSGIVKRYVDEIGSAWVIDITNPEKSTARIVSHVSEGVLASTDPIRVRFVSPVVGKSQVGQVLRTRVFRFVPSIDGLATWERRIRGTSNPWPCRRVNIHSK